MKACIIAEYAESAAKLAVGVRAYADTVRVVLIGTEDFPAGIADEAYRVVVPEGSLVDDADATIAQVIEEGAFVVSEPTRRLKAVIGKLAAQKGAAVITDALSIEDGVAASMYFGGVAHVQRKAVTATAFYTMNPNAFDDVAASGSATPQELAWVAPKNPLKKLSSEPIVKSGVDLTKVDVVVAAGRGFAEKDDLGLAYEFCDKIGAGLGCSRPLSEGVDWFSSEAYIGVSGLMLSPKVYVGLGISGQMQHMVGVNRAEKVFAVNKDKSAPIFKQCDMGIVGDIKTVLPALNAALGA